MASSFMLLFFILLSRLCHCRTKDWLVTDLNDFPKAKLNRDCDYNGFECIELSNSLISRKFIISPNFFTVEYNSFLTSHQEYALRSPFSPEAIIGFDHHNYSIGGVSYINNTNTTAAFWDPSFLKTENIAIDDDTFIFESHSISSSLYKVYDWTPGTRGSLTYIPWPPKGLQLNVTFKPPISAPENIRKSITVTVQYEMYQGMPLLSKRVFIESSAPSLTSDVLLTYVQVEQLKTNIPYGVGEKDWDWGDVDTPMVPFPGQLWIELDVPKVGVPLLLISIINSFYYFFC